MCKLCFLLTPNVFHYNQQFYFFGTRLIYNYQKSALWYHDRIMVLLIRTV